MKSIAVEVVVAVLEFRELEGNANSQVGGGSGLRVGESSCRASQPSSDTSACQFVLCASQKSNSELPSYGIKALILSSCVHIL